MHLEQLCLFSLAHTYDKFKLQVQICQVFFVTYPHPYFDIVQKKSIFSLAIHSKNTIIYLILTNLMETKCDQYRLTLNTFYAKEVSK